MTMTNPMVNYVIPFRQLTLEDLPRVGGKSASLGEMLQALATKRVPVPDGFAVTAEAFRATLREAGLADDIYCTLDRLDPGNIRELKAVAHRIRERVRAAPLPGAVSAQLTAAYRALSAQSADEFTDVAVRSSATAEDLPGASFAGQHETFLNIRGLAALDAAVRSCFASLFTDRAIVYRVTRGFAHRNVAMSVGIQKMVRSDLASGGVIFTLDSESGFPGVVLVTGAWGLAETVVQGRVRPDEFWVHKPTLKAGFPSIIRRERGAKAVKLIYAEGGTKAVQEVRVPDRKSVV